MRKVLLATDASEHSLRAARLLHRMAQNDPEMEVTVLHVVPLPDVLSPAAAAGAPLTVPMQVDEYLKGQLEQVLDATVAALDLPPERVRRAHAMGHAAESIMLEARQGRYDLVVLGRRGLSPIRELFVGSVSKGVLNGTPCPVLIVP
jgi:nucleotide-binding universal stress UspA family protein